MTAPYRLKAYPELLANAFARMRAVEDPDVDLNVGSPDRTVLEIMCLADADQYVQIGKVLDLSSIDKVMKDDLDRFGLIMGSLFFNPLRRRQPAASFVKIAVGDGSLVARARIAADFSRSATFFSVGVGEGDAFPSSFSAWIERGTARAEKVVLVRSGDVFSLPSGAAFTYPHAAYGEVARVATQSLMTGSITIGGTSVSLAPGTGSAWPSSGTVILDRGTAFEEKKTFTKSGDTLTLGSGASFAHSAGASAILGTFGSDRSIDVGLQVFVPATESSKRVTFTVFTSGKLLDGDIVSDLIDAQCVDVGEDTNVGAGTVVGFSAAPFTGAVVTNPLPAVGGRDLEKDD